MFTSGMRESTQREIELKGISANGLAKCLQIIYKSRTHFDSSADIFDVIAAANHLQFLLVVDYCEQNLLTMLTCDNFNYFIEMCKYYGLQRALEQIDLFIVDNLAKIIQNSCSSHISSTRNDSKSKGLSRKQSSPHNNKRFAC
jgi:kelch-like protein 9/13